VAAAREDGGYEPRSSFLDTRRKGLAPASSTFAVLNVDPASWRFARKSCRAQQCRVIRCGTATACHQQCQ
jgi:hypothetical protein